MRFLDALRRQWGYPVPDVGERLLAQGKPMKFGEQDVISFDRMLSADECDAICAAWQRRYTGTQRGN